MTDPPKQEFEPLEQRRKSHRRWFYSQQPKRIDNVVAQLVQRKGYAQTRVAGERDKVWQEVVGDDLAKTTQVGSIRRGVFEVLVADSLLMQELTFRKEELLANLQEAMPDANLCQLRLRVAKIATNH